MRLFFLLSMMFGLSTLIMAQTPNKAEDISPMLIGETLPNGTLQDLNGKDQKILNLFKQKPTVLVFYRGGWCPYCNLQLSGLMDIEQDILDLGYQIVAVTPEDYQNLKETEEEGGLKYQLFSDPMGAYIQKIGIAFKTPLKNKAFMKLKGQKGKATEVLPVPTVMIIDTKGKILFEYINPDYQKRLSEEMLLAVLKTIDQEA